MNYRLFFTIIFFTVLVSCRTIKFDIHNTKSLLEKTIYHSDSNLQIKKGIKLGEKDLIITPLTVTYNCKGKFVFKGLVINDIDYIYIFSGQPLSETIQVNRVTQLKLSKGKKVEVVFKLLDFHNLYFYSPDYSLSVIFHDKIKSIVCK